MVKKDCLTGITTLDNTKYSVIIETPQTLKKADYIVKYGFYFKKINALYLTTSEEVEGFTNFLKKTIPLGVCSNCGNAYIEFDEKVYFSKLDVKAAEVYFHTDIDFFHNFMETTRYWRTHSKKETFRFLQQYDEKCLQSFIF